MLRSEPGGRLSPTALRELRTTDPETWNSSRKQQIPMEEEVKAIIASAFGI
jgi:hypothetical protein